MRSRSRAKDYLRGGMLALALMLPLVSLVGLGSLWLFQNGYLLVWALAACAVTSLLYLLQVWGLKKLVPSDAPPAGERETPDILPPEPSWTPREQAAWGAVVRVAQGIDTAKLDSPDAILELGRQTLEEVARQFHPGEESPLLKFTVPEALALVERVSGELKPFIIENVPLGDQLTVGQVIKLYSWRTVIDYAEQAYDIWRFIRLLNPAAAATQEIRERFSKKIYEMGREHLMRTLAERYVEEVGHAAIDLYSGRLRVSSKDLAGYVSKATERDRQDLEGRIAEPLRILVAGQINAGKSSLINALSNEVQAAVDSLPATASFPAYELTREGLPAALIIDSPGVKGDASEVAILSQAAGDCDLIIWVADPSRPDREPDRIVLEGIRSYFAANPNRRRPPMMLVLSHIDRLRPFQEWSPPYDLLTAQREKARSIRDAMQLAGEDLGFALPDIVPACLGAEVGCYNIDAIWARIAGLVPEAQRAQLVRRLGGARGGFDWNRLWSQAVNAGAVIARAVVRRPPGSSS